MYADWINKEGLTFDDVLLVPQYTEIESRLDVNLNTSITKEDYGFRPILSSNMDTITESEMMIAMTKHKCLGVLHRFMNDDDIIKNILTYTSTKEVEIHNYPICFSIGINKCYRNLLDKLCEINLIDRCIIFIDVAHGACKRVVDAITNIKRNNKPNYLCRIVAGNVATPQDTVKLCKAGADAVKVGIGPGSMCTTRLVTGVGVPQLTAIKECSEVASKFGIPIIADGGITKSGDIVKALAAGASSVMIGSLFAGTDETPGESVGCQKVYRGMASEDAMVGWKNKYHAAPEGESRYVECKGSAVTILDRLLAGIRSGMTYCNSRSIDELHKNAIFRRVSSNTLIENRPNGLER